MPPKPRATSCATLPYKPRPGSDLMMLKYLDGEAASPKTRARTLALLDHPCPGELPPFPCSWAPIIRNRASRRASHGDIATCFHPHHGRPSDQQLAGDVMRH